MVDYRAVSYPGWKVTGAPQPKVSVAGEPDWKAIALEQSGRIAQLAVENLDLKDALDLPNLKGSPAPPPRTMGDTLAAAMVARCAPGLPLP